MSGYLMVLKVGGGCSSSSVDWGLSKVQMALVSRRPMMVLPKMGPRVAESSKKLVSNDIIVILFFSNLFALFIWVQYNVSLCPGKLYIGKSYLAF